MQEKDTHVIHEQWNISPAVQGDMFLLRTCEDGEDQ